MKKTEGQPEEKTGRMTVKGKTDTGRIPKPKPMTSTTYLGQATNP